LALFKYFPFAGLQKDFLRIAEEALARGHRVTVFTREWQGEKPQGLQIALAPQTGWSKGGWQNHVKDRNFANWLQSVRGEYDLDVLLGFNRMPGLDFYFAADPCYQFNRARGWRSRFSARARHFLTFERTIFSPGQATQIFTLTEKQKREYIASYGTEERRFIPVPPGISRNFCYETEAALAARQFVRKQLQADADEVIFLHVGSSFQRKGVDRCIEALAGQARARLAIVGQDKPEKYRARAAALGVADRVHFIGPSQQVRDWMLGADVLLHPAREEAAGMVLVEALIAGLPVIVSGVAGYATHIAASGAGVALAEIFSQQEFNKAVAQAITADERARWHKAALAYSAKTDLYNLGPVVLKKLEAFGEA
jgi:UDP-glucose:(heptosyl)LPS alpha-1,3-glucosyltransferase